MESGQLGNLVDVLTAQSEALARIAARLEALEPAPKGSSTVKWYSKAHEYWKPSEKADSSGNWRASGPALLRTNDVVKRKASPVGNSGRNFRPRFDELRKSEPLVKISGHIPKGPIR